MEENVVSEPEIKERSEIHGRFKGASWYPFVQNIIVGGVGGIGSWLTMMLARQGHRIFVYDDDTVSITNMGGQLYSSATVGLSKVEAISSICVMLASHSISTNHRRFDSNSLASSVMFSCFDNMASRKVMFERWHENWTHGTDPHCLFIDGRLNAETAEFFCVYDEKTAAGWLESWFPDEKVADAPCTFKATSHCAAILAGMMVSALNNFVANRYADEQRSVPFKTSIWLPTMTILTEEL